MPSTTVASGSFATRREANEAIRRLVSNGFARNSMDLHHRDDDGYDLEVHTRRENLRRVERLIHNSPSYYGLGDVASGTVQVARAHPLVLLGAGALAGFLIYTLMSRDTDHDPGRSWR